MIHDTAAPEFEASFDFAGKVVFKFNPRVIRILCFLTALCALPGLRADVTLAPVFGDHMVLQQGVTLPVWGSATPGERVLVSCGGRDAEGVADSSGRWRVTLRPIPCTGERLSLIVNGSNRIEIRDVVAGDVWIAAGEGEMVSPLSSSFSGSAATTIADTGTRFFVRERNRDGSLKMGRWVVVSPADSPSLPAVPFFFARDLRAARKIPVGVVDCATEESAPIASWISTKGLKGLALPADRAGTAPSALFDALIRPLVPFAITGVIWNQGRSDEGANALRHRLFLGRLIRDWRGCWGQGPFPFLMVSPSGEGVAEEGVVEDYLGPDHKPHGAWPWIREGIAANAISIPFTAMVVTTDLPSGEGESNGLVIGRRLALAARAKVHGEEIPCSGPTCREIRIEGRKARVLFDDADGGLVAGSPPQSGPRGSVPVSTSLRGFALAGQDGKWFPATVTIEGETVLLASDAVPRPVAVRYNWRSLATGNLYNRAGLPAPPFRSDHEQPVSTGNPLFPNIDMR